MTAPAIAAVVEATDFGRPTAAKRGRNPRYPWVPIVDYGEQAAGVHATRTRQILGRAFATRDEAVACAVATIERDREILAGKLADPRHRALREAHGLPREIEELAR